MTSAATTIDSEDLDSGTAGPLLVGGDRLSREEFECRYHRMPNLKKAELIEGVVYMPSPVSAGKHGFPQMDLGALLWIYAYETPGVKCADNSTVRLDVDNEPQPDLVLLKIPDKGGQAHLSADGYIEGAPDLVVEIVGSTSAYDLHQKKWVYRRNGVREYLAWITEEKRLVWWQLREGEYVEIVPLADGVIKSVIFPGLWLDAQALLRGDHKAAMAMLRQGLDSPEHREFLLTVS